MKNIDYEQLQDWIKNEKQFQLIDVREANEHASFNIGGTLLPLGKIQTMQTDDIDELKSEEVICYCRSGQRSMQAAMMLETFGFTNVKNLAGGMLGWQEKYK